MNKTNRVKRVRRRNKRENGRDGQKSAQRSGQFATIAPRNGVMQGIKLLGSHFNANTQLTATGDATYYADPNIKASHPQAVHKKDVIKLEMDPHKCVIEKDFALGNFAKGARLLWAPPLNYKWPSSGNNTPELEEGDVRGTFIDLVRCVVTFKNILDQPIRVMMNSPRGRISDPGKPYVRAYKKQVTIPAKQQRTFRLAWGDHSNIYTPMVVNAELDSVTKRKASNFVMYDFMVIIPNTNIMSGDPFAASGDQDLTCCQVVTSVHYISTAQYAGTLTVSQRSAFLSVKNDTKAAMLAEESIDANSLTLPRSEIKRHGGMEVLYSGGKAHDVGLGAGDLFSVQGINGFFKVHDDKICAMWDVEDDKPAVLLDGQRVVPEGARVQVIGRNLDVSFADIIGYLTALTEFVRIVSLLF